MMTVDASLFLLYRDNKWTNIVASRFIVFLVSTVAEWEGSRQPTAAVDLLAFLYLVHRRNFWRIQVNLFGKKLDRNWLSARKR
jgi:hypothetical protein